ncbi:membrane protein [Cnuibacter physcomitrellae]|uniref:Neutral zinc metallopeptidase n=1 Tax=Cnuibacter physcomitrellae TaxID=1619308 RepID=A0A1X9LKG3_9MICO|nr:neutral zinc metallopeptidase [Cnuibacter physcomitrellae]ARJ04421.1 neutral zinc metallopeptidase [Cnuibacter physcomitrellae]GGI41014.1 membrane protein [Cnuibacter physcomitrellae]
MTFDERSRLDPSKVSKRRTTGIAVGGGSALVVIGLIVLSQFLGVDLTGLAGVAGGGGAGSGPVQEESLDRCTTGEAANADTECLMVGAANSLDVYWADEAPALGLSYRSPADFVLFSGQTSTGCGSATSAVGPFYCPADETIYLDTSFFDELRSRFGANGGTLAQMYVVAHEWGHHIQRLAGGVDGTDRGTGAGSESVRTELQADCYAGAWAAAASSTTDQNGVAFLEPLTKEQIADALDAASVIGDDRIQQQSGGGIDPDTWTHGSSASRQKWFQTGFDSGPSACDTFSVPETAL